MADYEAGPHAQATEKMVNGLRKLREGQLDVRNGLQMLRDEGWGAEAVAAQCGTLIDAVWGIEEQEGEEQERQEKTREKRA